MSLSALSVRVARITQEALDIRSFELVSADGQTLPGFSAGSHLDVETPDGITRQYSLCNNPTESHRYLIGVLKDPTTRGGSKAMHEKVNEGDVLRIGAPKNHFALVHGAKRALLLAGGIGVTPILCMAERLSIAAADFEMHYCARERERMAFHDRIQASAFAARVHMHFDNGAAQQKFDIGATLATPEPGTHVYVCGPKGFMDAVLGAARAGGWPEEQLHYEFFSAEPLKLEDDGSFQVKLASSGKIVTIPKDVTITDALADAGVYIPTSCEQGVCGTCMTRVLEGTPDHRDLFLMPDEQEKNDQFTPCCSRSKSPLLVLDL
ncbi:MAG: PDR/VanB family oxidoreductase [Burkholderiaceae bacterium]